MAMKSKTISNTPKSWTQQRWPYIFNNAAPPRVFQPLLFTDPFNFTSHFKTWDPLGELSTAITHVKNPGSCFYYSPYLRYILRLVYTKVLNRYFLLTGLITYRWVKFWGSVKLMLWSLWKGFLLKKLFCRWSCGRTLRCKVITKKRR